MLDVLLLNYACHNAVAERFGEEHISTLAQQQYHHLAPVTVHRLRNTFGIEGEDMDAVLKVLQLNPFVPREYFDLGFSRVSETRGLVWLNDSEGYREPVKRGLASLMVSSPDNPGFERLAQEVNPRAVVREIDAAELGELTDIEAVRSAWEIVIDPDAVPATRSDWADMVGNHMWDLDNSRHVYLYEKYDALG
jgi:hypothetical protein